MKKLYAIKHIKSRKWLHKSIEDCYLTKSEDNITIYNTLERAKRRLVSSINVYSVGEGNILYPSDEFVIVELTISKETEL